MENDLWVEKYKPTKLEDVIGNKKVIKNIESYIKSIYECKEKKHIIMISGPVGIGKSLVAKLVLEKFKYRIIELNASNTKIELANILNKAIHYKNVLELFMDDKRTTAVIIEELETMCMMGCKSNITELTDIIKKSEKKNPEKKNKIQIPVIMTSNNSTEKKITSLRNISQEFVLKKITKLTMKKFLDNIIKKEKIDINDDIYKQILTKSCGDLRLAIMMLYDVYMGLKCNIPKSNSINIYKKDNEMFINESVNDIFTKKKSLNNLENIYYLEPFLIPLMLHENYIKILMQPEYKNKKLNKLDSIIKCAETLISTDLYNSSIILNQYYSIQEYMPYFSNIPINREFMKYKTTIKSNDIYFSKLFNKLSQKINKKIKVVTLLLNIQRPLIDYTDFEIFTLISIYYTYKYKNYKYLKELMQYYNITYPQYEQIIKFYTKTGFYIKLKTELIALF